IAKVRCLAAVGTGQRLDVLRPAPPRLECCLANHTVADVQNLDLPLAAHRPHLVRRGETLLLEPHAVLLSSRRAPYCPVRSGTILATRKRFPGNLGLRFPSSPETFPFGPETSAFKVAGKIFAITALTRQPLQVSLKCDPLLAELLREAHPAVRPGYHLNKRHWNTVTLDGSVPDQMLEDM